MGAIEQAHAPDYELVTPGGHVLSRTRYIELIAEAPFYSAWELGSMQARASPSMGAVKYKAKLTSNCVAQCGKQYGRKPPISMLSQLPTASKVRPDPSISS